MFEPRCTIDGQKVVLGHVIKAGGGRATAKQVLDILATHPSTARFIATKLARRFVSDTPPPALVDRLAARFRETDGDLREVMRTLLTSPEFLSPDALSREGQDAVRIRRQRRARDRRRRAGRDAARARHAAARDAALSVPAADRLQGHGRRVGQHRRARQPDELRACSSPSSSTAVPAHVLGRIARARAESRSAATSSDRIVDNRAEQRLSRTTRAHDRESDDAEQAALTLGSPEFQTKVAMTSRRVFVKNGAFALVSLGFAPSFLARTAFAAGAAPRSKRLIAIFQRGAVDGLNVIVPFGDSEYYRARPSIAIARPGRERRRGRSRRLLRIQSAARAAQAVLGRAPARHRPRVRLARQHALALRRAGLHGNGHARRQEHVGRLAESVSAGAARSRTATPFRAVALTQQLPRVLQGIGAGARGQSARAVRHPRRPGQRHGRRVVRERSIAAAADQVLNSTGREAFDAIKMLKGVNPASYRPEHGADYPRRRSGRRCSRSRSSRRRTSASRSPSPTSAAGTRTSTRDRRRASSRRGSTTSPAASRRSSPISAIAWQTPSS